LTTSRRVTVALAAVLLVLLLYASTFVVSYSGLFRADDPLLVGIDPKNMTITVESGSLEKESLRGAWRRSNPAACAPGCKKVNNVNYIESPSQAAS